MHTGESGSEERELEKLKEWREGVVPLLEALADTVEKELSGLELTKYERSLESIREGSLDPESARRLDVNARCRYFMRFLHADVEVAFDRLPDREARERLKEHLAKAIASRAEAFFEARYRKMIDNAKGENKGKKGILARLFRR